MWNKLPAFIDILVELLEEAQIKQDHERRTAAPIDPFFGFNQTLYLHTLQSSKV